MRVHRQAILPAGFADLLETLRRPAFMVATAAPLVELRSAEPEGFPSRWLGGPHRLTLRLFGRIPLGQQVMNLSWPASRQGQAQLHDTGHSPLIKRWDHRIMIKDMGNGSSSFSDTLDIDAGPLTPIFWLAAQILLSHQKRQLVKLVQQGLDKLR